ncbi:MAG TPA: methyltransferase domain-containing protein [Bacteroidales bacterium]|nr:methyltransferase domain-containing protein [Bacteroidales bacterium]
MSLIEINKRYTDLAGSDCCLSCGGAINYAALKTGEVGVDLGSGRGTDVLRMAEEVGESGFVYGIDISDGMLEKARQNAAKFGIENVRFVRSELEKMDLPDAVADLVISNCTINHAGDKQAVWNEIYRILKKGGRFVVSDIYATQPIAEEYRNDPVAISECWAGAVTRKEYMETLAKAGFSKIEIIEESSPYKKGQAEVASFTIAGFKSSGCCS